MSEVVVCETNRWGPGCGHATTDHLGEGKTPNIECCCCTWRHNDQSHVDGCLDCSIMHGKRQCRIRGISDAPTTVEVEPFIPDALKQVFWNRYVGKYFDQQGGEDRD